MNQNNLKAKDLITTAVFTVVFALVVFVASMTLGMIPVGFPFLVSAIGLIGGIIWTYMRVKVPKPFTITIQCIVSGALFFILGTYWGTVVGCIVGGILADIITSVGKYKSFKLTTAGFAVFCLCVHFGSFLVVLVARDWYYEYCLSSGMTVEWMETFLNFLNWPVMLGTGVLSAVCAIVGMLIGKALLKKHFVKAGII
ncbi:MAG: MptD family putative ECF transporter S component [Oscillospiraceae bacterium]|jgi:energy-coupling factor transport system substrate-specific component|nr:MptD family putative ECF transporter S component [Oscillospiraceae bacterium]